jgi:predicted acyltransferase
MMSIRNALILAGLILAVSLGLVLASDLIDPGTSQRVRGAMMGIVLVICANLVPKTLKPLAAERCDPSTKQAMQRFAGWALVLAGLGYSLAWLVLPLDSARVASLFLVTGGVALVVARVTWSLVRRERTQPPAEL